MPEFGTLGVASSAQLTVMAPGREVNQDAVGRWAPELLTTRSRTGVVYVVADGVGTRAAGQLASRTAVETVLHMYRHEFDGEPRTTLERAVRQAGQAILALTVADPALRGMASTCTAAAVHHSRLTVAHVGDSRAYLVRHGRVRQLTQDHTWAGEQTHQAGLELHPLSSAPTRLLGAAQDITVDLLEEPLEDGDVIILGTDGLSATLDHTAISQAVHGDDALGAADRLIRAARSAGSSDDISVTVLAIEPVLQPTEVRAAPAKSPRTPAITAVTWSDRLVSPAFLAGLGVAGLAFLMLGAFWIYQLTFSGRVFPGVHALGADLGGRTLDDAARALESQFAEYARQPLTLEVAGQQFFLTAGELGARFDAAATAEGALSIGRSGSFPRQITEQARSLISGRDSALVYQVDDARMQATLSPLAQRVEATAGVAVDAALLIDASGAVRLQPSRNGRTLDREASAAMIRNRLQGLGAGTLRLSTIEVPPAVSEADLSAPRAIAERLLAQPLVVTADTESIQLDRTQLATILSVRKELMDGRPRVSLHLLDGETWRLLQPLSARVARPPVHARFNWSASGLSLAVPGVDGQEIFLTETVNALEQHILTRAGPVTLPIQPIPAFGPANSAALDIRELLIDTALPITGAAPWTRASAELALREIHGRLVLPGQTFSLLDAVGAIVEARSVPGDPDGAPGSGQGVNLAATALTQVVFWSGYTLEERHAPPEWTIRAGAPPRGQPGLDALVDAEQRRDFRFTNSSDQPLLIQAGLDGEHLIVALYGTKPTWTVQTSEPVLTNLTSPDGDPERRDDPSIPAGQEVWLEDRSDGFSVSLRRTVILPGTSAPRTLDLTSTYAPNRGILLVGTRLNS
ncbi:MAG: protein phosphatase 2C domain-containing protein [Chloroflexota bacterium]